MVQPCFLDISSTRFMISVWVAVRSGWPEERSVDWCAETGRESLPALSGPFERGQREVRRRMGARRDGDGKKKAREWFSVRQEHLPQGIKPTPVSVQNLFISRSSSLYNRL